MQKNHGNQKGFTLIELLVTITILAIIVTPFLHSFVSVMRTNEKSKKVEQATTAARNVMERVKAYPFESLARLATYGAVGAEGKLEITYSGADAIEVNHKKYKAVVTLDPSYNDAVRGDEATEYNKNVLANIYNMDSARDAFYLQPEGQDDEMAEKLRFVWKDDEDNEILESLEDVKKEYQRNMLVSITNNGSGQKVKIETEYKHKAVTSAAVTLVGMETEKTEYAVPDGQEIYASVDNSIPLRNIYIFYQPMYNASLAEGWKETMTVKNETGKPVQVYLIKQKNPNPLVPVDETGYGVFVNVWEKDRAMASMLKDGKPDVWTRLCTNLDFTSPAGSGRQILVKYKTTEAEEYQTDYPVGVGIEKTADQLTGLTDLAAQKQKNRIYKVKVMIYEEGDDTHAITSMEGTKER